MRCVVFYCAVLYCIVMRCDAMRHAMIRYAMLYCAAPCCVPQVIAVGLNAVREIFSRVPALLREPDMGDFIQV